MSDDPVLLTDLLSHRSLNEFIAYDQAMCQCPDVCRCPGMEDNDDEKETPVRTEPAAVGAAVATAINLIVLLVLKHELSKEEQAAIVGATTLLAGLYIRSRVQPVG